MAEETYKGTDTITAEDRKHWRKWLSAHQSSEKRIWLIIFHKDSGIASINYEEAVEEALCYGWIDSLPNKRDDQSYYQLFSKRNPKSNWSRKNKLLVEKLMNQSRMTSAGLTMVEQSKQSGTWSALDGVENLITPPDLKAALEKNPFAEENFESFPPSVKRGILEWIFNAKRPETRAKRIEETATKASQNIRANQFRT